MRALLEEKIRTFLQDEQGPTVTEYAVMLGLIVVGVMVAMGQFGVRVSGIYSIINSTMPT